MNKREVFYTLHAVHRKRGLRIDKGTYALYTDARLDGLTFHNKRGWNMEINRVSISIPRSNREAV